MFPPYRYSVHRGFTLIELLLVVNIIAILVSIILLALQPARRLAEARNAARRNDVLAILQAIQQHIIERGTPPAGIDGTLRMIGTSATGCDIFCTRVGIPMVTKTLSVRVAASNEDAEESILPLGDIRLQDEKLELAHDAEQGDQIIGMRFAHVAIPREATILAAHITMHAASPASAGKSHLTFFGHATDDAPAFVHVHHDIENRTRTAANVPWNPADWTEPGAEYETPDLREIVQEIVRRPGWGSGQSLAFLVEGTGTRFAASYDGDPAASPILTITAVSASGSILPERCLDLSPALVGPLLGTLPHDPHSGSAEKTYYAVERLPTGRVRVEACGAELGEEISAEQ